MTDAAPPTIDLDHLRRWIGPVQTTDDTLSARHAALMAATIARPEGAPGEGTPLPLLWHWLYFLEARPPAELGPDGHPARGGFLPPVPLPNRMWAGGRVEFLAPLPVGAAVQRRSQVLKVEHKRGRTGDLVFVTVGHEVWTGGAGGRNDRSAAGQPVCALREEQDLVYKAPTPPGAAVPGAGEAPPPAGEHVRPYAPDATMLFRYSALTFNGHRIHYDLDYCRHVEGYDNLVIHGPLSATMLAALAVQVAAAEGAGRVARFSYRGVRPAILGKPLTLNARRDGARLQLWTALADGWPSMQAEAELA